MEHVLVALAAITVALGLRAEGAAPLGVPTPREPAGQDSEHFTFSGALSQELSSSVPKATGWQGHPVRGGGQPPHTVRTQGSHPSLPLNENIRLAPREAVRFCPGLRGGSVATNK